MPMHRVDPPTDDAELDELLARPLPGVGPALTGLSGDLVILGAGGKMGPTLARMAVAALRVEGSDQRVVAVSRFTDASGRQALEDAGVHTVAADLTNPEVYAGLPDAGGVMFMLGVKFGTSGGEHNTWWSNAAVPAFAAARYRGVPTVAYSTGNVYPLVPVVQGGCQEDDPLGPVGEYAMSCLGRERVFSHAAEKWSTPTLLFRLNYAVELRYGVIADLAVQIREGRPVDLSMPAVNVVWQGDAVAWSLRSFTLATSPAAALNATGPETIPVATLAGWLAADMGVEASFTGQPGPDALLSNAGRCVHEFGYPTVDPRTVTRWVASWVGAGGRQLGKPTKFQQRKGAF